MFDPPRIPRDRFRFAAFLALVAPVPYRSHCCRLCFFMLGEFISPVYRLLPPRGAASEQTNRPLGQQSMHAMSRCTDRLVATGSPSSPYRALSARVVLLLFSLLAASASAIPSGIGGTLRRGGRWAPQAGVVSRRLASCSGDSDCQVRIYPTRHCLSEPQGYYFCFLEDAGPMFFVGSQGPVREVCFVVSAEGDRRRCPSTACF